MHKELDRVKLHYEKSPKVESHDEICAKLSNHSKVLCIVNTRKDAKEIFDRLPTDGYKIHLSRNMCPKHLKDKLSQVKQLLAEDKNETLRIVSTQLIEAGVDIDFPVVYRQEAGLDSILQAAGRCNREGKLKYGEVFMFSLGSLPPGYLSMSNSARQNMSSYDDIFSPEIINEYFSQLLSRYDNYDEKGIHKMLSCPMPEYKSADENFKLIEDNTVSVLVPYGEWRDLYERCQNEGITRELYRKLSQYMVAVKIHEIKELISSGLVEETDFGFYKLISSKNYDLETGLNFNNHFISESQII